MPAPNGGSRGTLTAVAVAERAILDSAQLRYIMVDICLTLNTNSQPDADPESLGNSRNNLRCIEELLWTINLGFEL